MIDLRSDTLTKPTESMIQAITHAELGDDGRTNENGKGEDPTVNKLENLAASITGHEDALFCNSGTMANIIALLIHCKRGDKVILDKYSHIFQSEKSLFDEQYFGLTANFYETNDSGLPLKESIKSNVSENDVKLIALENSIAYQGGTCISTQQMNSICKLAEKLKIPVHLDGARIFNVAGSFNLPVKHFTARADSVQICLSKALGAPVGSVLCGSKSFIKHARGIRKKLGGGMRQAGIIAAAGVIALTKGTKQMNIDNQNAYYLAEGIMNNKAINLNIETVQTNIIIFDVSPSGLSAKVFATQLAEEGLHVRPINESKIRIIVYREIDRAVIIEAIEIINKITNFN